jgi:hypothetical protein
MARLSSLPLNWSALPELAAADESCVPDTAEAAPAAEAVEEAAAADVLSSVAPAAAPVVPDAAPHPPTADTPRLTTVNKVTAFLNFSALILYLLGWIKAYIHPNIEKSSAK